MQPFDSRGFKETQSSCSLMCQDNRQWIFYKSSIWKPIKLSCGNDGPSLFPAGLLREKLAFDATPIEFCARKCCIMNHINLKIKRFYPHFWSRCCCFKSLSTDREPSTRQHPASDSWTLRWRAANQTLLPRKAEWIYFPHEAIMPQQDRRPGLHKHIKHTYDALTGGEEYRWSISFDVVLLRLSSSLSL